MVIDRTGVSKLCGKLLVILLLTAGLYGASMGAYRWLHPEYTFSDFELTPASAAVLKGRVAGMNAETKTVYTKDVVGRDLKGAEIRFNLTCPTDPYKVISVADEKGYGAIQLAPDAELKEPGAWKLPLLVALKTPLLLLLTLLICYLAMYILNLAIGLGLYPLPTMALMIFALAATGTVLGVFIPIVALFSVVTESYHFIKILHVVVFIIAGLFGVRVLYEGLMKLAPENTRGPRTQALLLSWLLLYCLVGAQLAWTLKPFLGTPYLPSTPPFRPEMGNIYVSFFQSLSQLGR
jgi:hypothetical protein